MPTQGYDANETTQCESYVLSVNFNFNSTSSVAGMLASRQRNELDGLHDAQNAVFDEYYSNNGPKTISDAEVLNIF